MRREGGKQPDGTTDRSRGEAGLRLYPNGATATQRSSSTTFIGAIETADAFGWRLYGEARAAGWIAPRGCVVLGDGAQLDQRHRRSTLSPSRARLSICIMPESMSQDLCCFSRRSGKSIAIETWWTDLDAGKIEKIQRSTALQRSPGAGKPKARYAYLES